jgi:4'-phosphopantetheinyl transferase
MSDIPRQAAPLELPEDEVHLWYVLTDRASEPALLEMFATVLNEEETQRWQRFSFEEGRRQYLVSHGFVRTVLSLYADVHPAEWHFVRNGYGKPEVAAPAHARPLCFNLTHTRGLAACVVAREREVGVDAEDWERQGRDLSEALIRRCLSPVERACYQALAPSEQKHAFFDYWTLKEAYLKARGFGLTLPVEEIAFHWSSGVPHVGAVGVSFGPAIGDDPQSWHFERHVPSERHKIAVAVRHVAGPPLKIVVREFPG